LKHMTYISTVQEKTDWIDRVFTSEASTKVGKWGCWLATGYMVAQLIRWV
jgi:hypothetical protein